MNESAAMPRPKVLVVDDQPANLLAAGKILQRLPVEVLTARSGTEALGLLLRNEFAVILLDVRMPGMDGYETATLIREHTQAEPVPIIFVTAEASEQKSVFKGYESGAVDYLLKPIEEDLLLSKLRIFLDLYDHRQRLAQATRALARSTLRLERLLDAVGDGIVEFDADGSVGFANPAASRLLEGTTAQLLATRAGDIVLVFRDIGERLQKERELRLKAEADHLTGLSNRLAFEEKLRQVLGRPGGANRPFAVLLIDLDGFKRINDLHGHAVGDIREPPDALAIGEKVRSLLAAPYECAGVALEIGASVGVGMYPRHADAIGPLLEAADMAMYQAKRQRARGVVMAKGDAAEGRG